jgi:hypothetical protein
MMPRTRREESAVQRDERMKEKASKRDEARTAADNAVDEMIKGSIDKHGA